MCIGEVILGVYLLATFIVLFIFYIPEVFYAIGLVYYVFLCDLKDTLGVFICCHVSLLWFVDQVSCLHLRTKAIYDS